MMLSQKETMLLNDLKAEEKLCIEKYNKYASQAQDQQLKTLFSSLGQQEQQHYDTINQILSGTVPNTNSSSQKPNFQQSVNSQQSSNAQQSSNSQQGSMQSQAGSQGQQVNDQYLCSDVLSTEKHVSSVYDTCIFEFKDQNVRDALNHIQKEEQEHGKQVYDYMSQHGMYN